MNDRAVDGDCRRNVSFSPPPFDLLNKLLKPNHEMALCAQKDVTDIFCSCDDWYDTRLFLQTELFKQLKSFPKTHFLKHAVDLSKIHNNNFKMFSHMFINRTISTFVFPL